MSRGRADAASVGVDPFLYLLEDVIPSWRAAAGPLCRDGVPVNARYAHGEEFLATQAAAREAAAPAGPTGEPPAR